MTPRDELEKWVLKLADEALAADPTGATEIIRALTGGQEVFCPQAYTSGRLHSVAAAFLVIARLSS